MKSPVTLVVILLVAGAGAYGIHVLLQDEADGRPAGGAESLSVGAGEPERSDASAAACLLRSQALELSDAQERSVLPALREHWAAARKAIAAASGSEAQKRDAVRNALMSNLGKLQLKIRRVVSAEELRRICAAYLQQMPALPPSGSPSRGPERPVDGG